MSRAERLNALRQAVHQYAEAEKKRIQNEVTVLQAVLNGRTAGKGIQQSSTSTVVSVAASDLAEYLQGA